MSRTIPMQFQQRHIDVLVARFRALKQNYDTLGPTARVADLNRIRHQSACVLLQAPTGIGKTLMACELMAKFSPEERILWLWFAPFTGVLDQAANTLRVQASSLPLLDIETDRHPEKLAPGAVFVLSWQTVAARSKESRLARQDSDTGLAVDELLAFARSDGYRIGVVVDEAHHGFVRATEASRFFGDILAPDYVLMMTATPRDADAAQFARQTGYQIGGPDDWASVTRAEGVDAQLLKRSVKAARFIAQNADDAQLVAYEEVALSECAAMHRLIKKTLEDSRIALTPLMLVQVPNGGQALENAKTYLTETLRFPASAVRVHTSDEPDPNLAALANDPQVEVILFKMAIATGFDAPRAFTLAALRGTRDADFGIQVVGRIMRVHRLLQGRLLALPPVLSFGYAFLANSEAQEGLVAAANRINQMPEQLAQAAASTVVTVIGGEPGVQVARPGQNLSLLPNGQNCAVDNAAPTQVTGAAPTVAAGTPASQATLFQVLAGTHFVHGFSDASALAQTFQLDAQRTEAVTYPLRDGAPRAFVTEALPPLPEDFEQRLVHHIDFSRVLGDRLKKRSRVVERTTDVFDGGAVEDKDVWANVSTAAIAERARQIAFAFDDVDRRELLSALKTRFRQSLTDEGHELPHSDEELTRQLELVLVRNPNLVRDAHKRLRAEQVQLVPVHLMPALVSDYALTPAARNVYGVLPPDMSPQEREFAELLDTSPEVLWWHRNPSRRPESVGLYAWSDGQGFFPDFVVGIAQRTEGQGVALSEVKGAHLMEYDKAKAGARHPTYGRVFMVGKSSSEGGFRLWRLSGDQLVDDGPLEMPRLRYS
ncbi:DEAD/DEAH box helicase [Ramlibacter alkalitolerans]|uniref:DEAD/DEAH box helicase family protein n=1 Tax=Ramlibacter alkalitolerans TaxID=2039631 RepID=A0ABS1JTY1_9BURK|nr:DEAD/DEAH box helicase family protein [Ramlibacter alkalitolerans]MBL0427687.1 DEAD/DEAH box helicase family protein [Ramlibacter alkalitolerans]